MSIDINMINNYNIFRNASINLKKYNSIFGGYPSNLLDIGAQYGGLSYGAIDRGAEFVMAIEADDKNYEQLAANINFIKKREDFDSILFHTAFCGDKYGEYVDLICPVIDTTERQSIMYSLDPKVIRDINKIKRVKTIKLKDIVSILKLKEIEVIDYLKIDVEGAEFEALPMEDSSVEFLKMVKFIDIELYPLNNTDYFGNKYNTYIYNPTVYKSFLLDCGFCLDIKALSNKITAQNLKLK